MQFSTTHQSETKTTVEVHTDKQKCVHVCEVRCSVLQCVATCCSVLQCVAVCCSVLHSRKKLTRNSLHPMEQTPWRRFRYNWVGENDTSRLRDMTRWCVTWLIYLCDVTYSDVQHDVFKWHVSPVWHGAVRRVTWPIQMWHVSIMCNDTFCLCAMNRWCVTWLMYSCDVTYSYVQRDLFEWRVLSSWHDSFRRVTWLSHMWHDLFICDMTNSFVWHACVTWLICVCHDSFIGVWKDVFIFTISFIQMCDTTCVICLIHMSHDSFICVTWRIHVYNMNHSNDTSRLCNMYVTWLICKREIRGIRMSNITYSIVWRDVFTCTTWLIQMTRLVCVTWLI